MLDPPRSQSTQKSSTSRRTPLRKPRRLARTLGDQAPSLHPRSVNVSKEAGSRLAAFPGPSPSVNPVSFPPMKVDATANSSDVPSQNPHHSAIPTPISKSSSVNSTLNWDASTSISNSPLLPTPPVSRKTAPYPPGFQPRGVCGVLTDDFLSARRMKRDGDGEGGMKRVERTKLERRLEKLINLHFPLQPDSKGARDGPLHEKTRPVHENRRASSIFDFQTLKNVNFNDASGLWKGVVSVGLQDTTKTEIRGWHLFQSMIFLCPISICQLLNKELLPGRMTQQRASVLFARELNRYWRYVAHLVSHYSLSLLLPQPERTLLKLCFSASFHPLTNRKHHCRLCGQIICSLPIKHPNRMALCSTLFVVDVQTRQVEEVGEGVDYGVRKRKITNVSVQQARQEEEDKFLRGVRICRTCRPILLCVSTSPSLYVLFYSFISGVTSMNSKCKLYRRS
jgi:rabenosyn-5